MGLADGLRQSVKNLGSRLEKVGMAKAISNEDTQSILRGAIPGAIMTTGFNLIGGVSPMTSVIAGALDLGLNVGGTKLAGRYAPGRQGTLSYVDSATKKTVTRTEYMPSGPQAVVQAIAPIASSALVMPLIQQQMQDEQKNEMDQTVSLQQQAVQRQLINGNLTQALSPGTQFQLQGLEQTLNPATLNMNLADPYGYARGMI